MKKRPATNANKKRKEASPTKTKQDSAEDQPGRENSKKRTSQGPRSETQTIIIHPYRGKEKKPMGKAGRWPHVGKRRKKGTRSDTSTKEGIKAKKKNEEGKKGPGGATGDEKKRGRMKKKPSYVSKEKKSEKAQSRKIERPQKKNPGRTVE